MGIVEPVDDFRVSNPPANAELLNALATNLAEYNYDFRRLVPKRVNKKELHKLQMTIIVRWHSQVR